MEIVTKTIKEVIQYVSLDKWCFAEEIQPHIEERQTVDFTEQKKRMAVCEKRIGQLQSRIDRKNEEIDLLKVGLWRIVKRYGLQTQGRKVIIPIILEYVNQITNV